MVQEDIDVGSLLPADDENIFESSVENPEFVGEAAKRFPNKIMVGIDARDGKVAIKGWVEVSNKKASDFARNFEELGISGFIFTDIGRDGMLEGPNLEAVREFAECTNVPVIASGGVGSIDDIFALLDLESLGVNGVILGKSLYDQRVNYSEAIKRISGNAG